LKACICEPQSLQNLLDFGNCLLSAGEFKQAEDAYREALLLDDSHPMPHFHYGQLFEKNKQPDHAVSAYESALKISKTCLDARLSLAALLSKLKRVNEAELLLREGLMYHDEPVSIYIMLGELYLFIQRPDAHIFIKEALTLVPENDKLMNLYKESLKLISSDAEVDG